MQFLLSPIPVQDFCVNTIIADSVGNKMGSFTCPDTNLAIQIHLEKKVKEIALCRQQTKEWIPKR